MVQLLKDIDSRWDISVAESGEAALLKGTVLLRTQPSTNSLLVLTQYLLRTQQKLTRNKVLAHY